MILHVKYNVGYRILPCASTHVHIFTLFPMYFVMDRYNTQRLCETIKDKIKSRKCLFVFFLTSLDDLIKMLGECST